LKGRHHFRWRKWGDNNKIILKELWYEGVDSIRLAQDRVQLRSAVKNALKLVVPQKKNISSFGK
jgi:hypothetical protein